MTEQQFEVNGPTSPTSPRGPTSAFMKNLTANAEMCVSCNKRVYPVDRLSTGNLIYHKACFRCTHCQKILSISQYTIGDNKPYCKPHYERVFKECGGRYNFSPAYSTPPAGSATGTTPIVVRQRSSDRGPITPVATYGGATTPGLLSPKPDATNADSVGSVKRLVALFGTGAGPKTPGGRGGTPAKAETPLSGTVSKMRAEREAACRLQEVSAARPAIQSQRSAESPSVQRLAVRVDKKNEQKTDEKQNKQEAQQEVKEQHPPPVVDYDNEQKTDEEKDKQAEQERVEQKLKEQEQSANHVDEELAENDDVQLDVQHQPPAADSGDEQKNDEKEDKQAEQERQEQKLEDQEQSVNHVDEEPVESQGEVQLNVKQEPSAADSDSDDDEHDYLQLVEEPSLEEKGPKASLKDDDIAGYHVEDEQDSDDQPPAADSRDDDSQQDVEERHVEEREQVEVAGGDDELVTSHEEDQLAEQQPLAADYFDEENNNDDNDDKCPDTHSEEDAVSAQEQPQQQQDGGHDDLMSF